MKIYKQRLTIGNEDKVLVLLNYDKEQTKEKTLTVDRLHHIHVIDRSYSMSSDINELVDNVQTTIDLMSDNDLISVVWFASEGKGDVLIKGATKSDDIKKVADQLRSTLGLTCFSEPLEKVNKIIDDLYVLCPNISVTFFTDGETVTDHSEQEEERRIFEQIDKMKDRVMALNCIGYGNYYNKTLLEEMSSRTTFGRLIHSSEVKEYAEIFSHTYQILSNMIMDKVNIKSKGDIIYLTSKNSKLSSSELELNFLDKIKNQFAFICDSEDDVVTINDEEYKISEINSKKIPKPTINNILYTYVYELYYKGQTEKAIDILSKNLKDKYAIDLVINAFTSEERKEVQSKLNDMIFVNKNRMISGECSEDYIPEKDAFCVMDLLKLLMNGNNFYVPVENYNRIGLSVQDTFNLFKAKEEKIRVPFNDFVFNDKHLNLSIRYSKEGEVSLNPRQASKVNLPETIPSKIYRNQTIIKDGNLNIKEFEAYIDRETMDTIINERSTSLIDLVKVISNIDEEGLYYVKFNLEVLPIINRMYAEQNDIKSILTAVSYIVKGKAYQKVLKYYLDIKKKEENHPVISGKTSYTPEQLEVLKEHGLNDRLEYQGVNNKTAEKNENDFYESRLIEFSIKGNSSLPKVTDVEKKYKPGCNLGIQSMHDAIKMVEDNNYTYEDIQFDLNKCKDKLINLNMTLNTLKMAKVLTGSWWEGLETDSKGNFTYSNGKQTLIIKNGRVKKFY